MDYKIEANIEYTKPYDVYDITLVKYVALCFHVLFRLMKKRLTLSFNSSEIVEKFELSV